MVNGHVEELGMTTDTNMCAHQDHLLQFILHHQRRRRKLRKRKEEMSRRLMLNLLKKRRKQKLLLNMRMIHSQFHHHLKANNSQIQQQDARTLIQMDNLHGTVDNLILNLKLDLYLKLEVTQS